MKTIVPLLAIAVSAATFSLTGCGRAPDAATSAATVVTASHGVTLNGRVHGAQQPVTGSAIYLFAAGATGYNGPSTSLLAGVSTDANGNGYVLSDSNGSFTITGDYTCPSAATQVYVAAVGGNPGLGAGKSNPNLAMMTALGPCGSLTPSTFVFVNEATTVASVWALAPFMLDVTDVSTSPGNSTGLANAFAAAGELANTTTGNFAGTTLPAGAVLPVTKMNTIADILAACINTAGGVAGDASVCGNLFTAATRGNATPKDTLSAALNIARSPVANAASLFTLSSSTAPFQPTLAVAPTDWTLAVQYTAGGFSNPKDVAIDAQGNAWIANCGSANCTTAGAGNVVELSPLGAPVATPYTAGGINIPVSIAIDLSGNAWIANRGGNSVTELTTAGTAVAPAYTGGGLSSPSAISIDGPGNVWVSNAGNSSVTELSSSGTPLSPGSGYTGSGVNAPVAIVTTPH
jgi:hypothetical protein